MFSTYKLCAYTSANKIEVPVDNWHEVDALVQFFGNKMSEVTRVVVTITDGVTNVVVHDQNFG